MNFKIVPIFLKSIHQFRNFHEFPKCLRKRKKLANLKIFMKIKIYVHSKHVPNFKKIFMNPKNVSKLKRSSKFYKNKN